MVSEKDDSTVPADTKGTSERQTNGVEQQANFPAQGTFVTHVHSYHQEQVRLADGKAAFVFALAGGLLAYCFQSGLHRMWLCPGRSLSPVGIMCLAGMFALAAGAVVTCMTVLPRLSPADGAGLVFFGSVASRPSGDAYSQAVKALDESALTRQLLLHVFELAQVCNRKFAALRVAMWATLVGVVLIMAVVAST